MTSEQDYMKVTIQDVDKDTKELKESRDVFQRSNIFREGDPKADEGKFAVWVRKKALWVHDKTFYKQRRYYTLHFIIKNWMLRPVFEFMNKLIGKNLLTDDKDIPQHWYNNHIRIFNYCFEQAIDDMWKIMIFRQKAIGQMASVRKITITDEETLNHVKKHNTHSYMMRQLFRKIWVTEMLEDTVDRECCNFFSMRLTHDMMELYGVSPKERAKVPMPGQYPVYVAKGPYDKEYFGRGAINPIWIHPDNREKVVKDVKDKDKKDKRRNKRSKNKSA